MLIAQINGRSIAAVDAKKGVQYKCPGCQGELILKKGEFKISHFAHKNSMCQIFSEGETPEHLLGKKSILAAYQKAGYFGKLEEYIKSLQQRPDVLVRLRNEKAIALEFQCAPLNLTKLSERSQGYFQAGLKFCWILGQRYHLKKTLTQQTSQFMQWSQRLGFYLLYFDTTRERFELVYGIQQADFLPLRYFHFFTKNVSELKMFMQQDHQIDYYELTMEERFKQQKNFLRNCYYSAGEFRKIQELAYMSGIRLQDLTAILLKRKYQVPLFQKNEFYWRAKIVLKYNKGVIINQKANIMVLRGINEYLFQNPFIRKKQFVEQIIQDFQADLQLVK
ncbi:competence protein CoiA [Liquorilactobacillus capillatus]|uniref:Competence protein transcription factor n=1 Tax=Liquorilactobacillus capillatus DSM 19910 TaxID=1423731 RepID=A0A0R1M4L2_9LACO|nr:competence protein CoiA family protein [Liquorilactobacillus capillatus]KRL03007.1 competence protein transcription factor [Liquorilactobacillus capillatus DSM 19910]